MLTKNQSPETREWAKWNFIFAQTYQGIENQACYQTFNFENINLALFQTKLKRS